MSGRHARALARECGADRRLTARPLARCSQALPDGAIKINLKGTSVGNGLTDPLIQYKYYKDMVRRRPPAAPVASAADAGERM